MCLTTSMISWPRRAESQIKIETVRLDMHETRLHDLAKVQEYIFKNGKDPSDSMAPELNTGMLAMQTERRILLIFEHVYNQAKCKKTKSWQIKLVYEADHKLPDTT